MLSAIQAMLIAAGTSTTCPTNVPTNRLKTNRVIVFLNAVSVTLPSMTSSVITDKCGSINTNIIIVATPFTTDDRVLAVTRRSGFKQPAYNAANTPTSREQQHRYSPLLHALRQPEYRQAESDLLKMGRPKTL